MKALSPALTAAPFYPHRRPYVTIHVSDPSRRWQVLHDSGEAQVPHAAALSGPNLVRSCIGNGGTVYTQTIPTPGPTSDFTPWSYTGYYNALAVALCTNNTEVSLLWVDSTRKIYHQLSPDQGLSWGSARLAGYSATTQVSALAACYLSLTHIGLFFAEGALLKFMECVSGAWSAPQSFTTPATNLTGVAVRASADTCHLLMSASTSSGTLLWVTSHSSSGYTQFIPICEAPLDTVHGYAAPALGIDHLYFSLGERVYESRAVGDFALGYVTEPQPVALSCTQGLAAAGQILATSSALLELAPPEPPLDISPYILELRREMRHLVGTLTLTLSHEAPTPQLGAQLSLATGYYTPAGPETAPAHTYFVERRTLTRKGATRYLTLEAHDRWHTLAHWRAPHALHFPGGTTLWHMVRFILARAGIELVGTPSPQMASIWPDFLIPPGASGMDTLRALLELVPDRLALEGHTALIIPPLQEPLEGYTALATHLSITQAIATPTHVRVEGAGGKTQEAFNWEGLATAPARYQYLREGAYEGPEAILGAAQMALDRATRKASRGAIVTAHIAGLELGDEISGYLVAGVVTHYHPARARYEDEIELEVL